MFFFTIETFSIVTEYVILKEAYQKKEWEEMIFQTSTVYLNSWKNFFQHREGFSASI